MCPEFEGEINLDILDLMVTEVRRVKDLRKKKSTNLFVHRENSISSTNLEMPSMVERDAVTFFTSLDRLLDQEKMQIEDFVTEYMPKYEEEFEDEPASPSSGPDKNELDTILGNNEKIIGWGDYDDDTPRADDSPKTGKKQYNRVGFAAEETPDHEHGAESPTSRGTGSQPSSPTNGSVATGFAKSHNSAVAKPPAIGKVGKQISSGAGLLVAMKMKKKALKAKTKVSAKIL